MNSQKFRNTLKTTSKVWNWERANPVITAMEQEWIEMKTWTAWFAGEKVTSNASI